MYGQSFYERCRPKASCLKRRSRCLRYAREICCMIISRRTMRIMVFPRQLWNCEHVKCQSSSEPRDTIRYSVMNAAKRGRLLNSSAVVCTYAWGFRWNHVETIKGYGIDGGRNSKLARPADGRTRVLITCRPGGYLYFEASSRPSVYC